MFALERDVLVRWKRAYFVLRVSDRVHIYGDGGRVCVRERFVCAKEWRASAFELSERKGVLALDDKGVGNRIDFIDISYGCVCVK